jgi:RNA polymerase sigma factor (TIGR02999 family)
LNLVFHFSTGILTVFSVSEVTQILDRVKGGEAEELLPLVYDELRKLAAAKLACEAPGQTLQATALVHEAWLRLGGGDSCWQNRAHFFSAASEAMRRILIEIARSKAAVRHGGGQTRVELDTQLATTTDPQVFLDLNTLLDQLAASDPFKAQVVKLKYFGGLEHAEIARMLTVSEKTVQRAWSFAKAWLYAALQRDSK